MMIEPGSMADWIRATALAGAFLAGAVVLSRSLVDEAPEIEAASDERERR
jgi:hypothetical protein